MEYIKAVIRNRK